MTPQTYQERQEVERIELLGHIITNLRCLETSIDELARLLNNGYVVEDKRHEIEKLLARRKFTRMCLRKTLLQTGGTRYMVPYWSM